MVTILIKPLLYLMAFGASSSTLCQCDRAGLRVANEVCPGLCMVAHYWPKARSSGDLPTLHLRSHQQPSLNPLPRNG